MLTTVSLFIPIERFVFFAFDCQFIWYSSELIRLLIFNANWPITIDMI